MCNAALKSIMNPHTYLGDTASTMSSHSSATLKVSQGDRPNYEFFRDLPMVSPNTKLGDAGSIISQVIMYTSRYTQLTSATLEVGQGDPNTKPSETFP